MYHHTVAYYETDKMGITHHSNYIRWMEEARIAFLKSIGWDYDKLEQLGIISPVVSVSCQYKKTTTFPDEVAIEVSITEFKGIKLILHYEMTNAAGETVCTADSSHCFLNEAGRPLRLKQQFPEFYQVLTDLASQK